MKSANLTSYTLWESCIDPLTFGSASLGYCALTGVTSMVDPLVMGSLLSAGVNALSITAICKLLKTNERNAYFWKICAVVSALGLSTIALPYVLAALGTQTAVALTYELALRFAVMHLVSKIGLYGSYRMAVAFKNHISPSDIRSKAPGKVDVRLAGKVITITVPEFLGNLVKRVQQYKLPKISFSLPRLPSFNIRFTALNPIFSKMKNGIVDCSKYIGRITKEINWKKVGTVALIGLIVITPALFFLSPAFTANSSATHSNNGLTLRNNTSTKNTSGNELTLPLNNSSSTATNHTVTHPVERAFATGNLPEGCFAKDSQDTVDKTKATAKEGLNPTSSATNSVWPEYLTNIANNTEAAAVNYSVIQEQPVLSSETLSSAQPMDNETAISNIAEPSSLVNETIETPPQEEFKDNVYFIGKLALPIITLGFVAAKIASCLNRIYSLNPLKYFQKHEKHDPLIIQHIPNPRVRKSSQKGKEEKSNSSGVAATSTVAFAVAKILPYLNPLEYFQKEEEVDNSDLVITRVEPLAGGFSTFSALEDIESPQKSEEIKLDSPKAEIKTPADPVISSQKDIEIQTETKYVDIDFSDKGVRKLLVKELSSEIAKTIFEKTEGDISTIKDAIIKLGNEKNGIEILIIKRNKSQFFASIKSEKEMDKRDLFLFVNKQITSGEFIGKLAVPSLSHFPSAKEISYDQVQEGSFKINYRNLTGKSIENSEIQIPANITLHLSSLDKCARLSFSKAFSTQFRRGSVLKDGENLIYTAPTSAKKPPIKTTKKPAPVKVTESPLSDEQKSSKKQKANETTVSLPSPEEKSLEKRESIDPSSADELQILKKLLETPRASESTTSSEEKKTP